MRKGSKYYEDDFDDGYDDDYDDWDDEEEEAPPARPPPSKAKPQAKPVPKAVSKPVCQPTKAGAGMTAPPPSQANGAPQRGEVRRPEAAALRAAPFPLAPGSGGSFAFDTPSPDDVKLLARQGGVGGPAPGRAGGTDAEPPSASARVEASGSQTAALAASLQRIQLSPPWQPDPALTAALARARTSHKPALSLLVLGHVDAGKSTLLGRLLADLGAVSARDAAKTAQLAAAQGRASFGLAWLLDARPEERARGVTVDLGQARAETPSRRLVLLDAPGHRDFVPAALGGTGLADAAVLVVDGSPGGFEAGFEAAAPFAPSAGSKPGFGGQTREHAQLARAAGVRQMALAVTKLDTIADDSEREARFRHVCDRLRPFLKSIGLADALDRAVPVCAVEGGNVVRAPEPGSVLAWWKGPTFLDLVEGFELPGSSEPAALDALPLRLPLVDVQLRHGGKLLGVAGKIAQGGVRKGDVLLAAPANVRARVKEVVVDGQPWDAAGAGEHVQLVLGVAEESGGAVREEGESVEGTLLGVQPGAVLCPPQAPVIWGSRCRARVIVSDAPLPLLPGQDAAVYCQAATGEGRYGRLWKAAPDGSLKPARFLTQGQQGEVEILLARPICFEPAGGSGLGRIALRDGGRTVAVGVVAEGPGDTVTAEVLENAPGQVVMLGIQGDHGRLSLEASDNCVGIAARAALDALLLKDPRARASDLPGIGLRLAKGLPLGSGLGSSAASGAAAAVAVNALFGNRLLPREVVGAGLASEAAVAGRHADNIAPAVLGGFVLVLGTDPLEVEALEWGGQGQEEGHGTEQGMSRPRQAALGPASALHFVLVNPAFEAPTGEMRAALPKTVPMPSLVHNSRWGAALAAAVLRGDARALGRALSLDCVVEPARAPLIPGMAGVKRAAIAAGAFGATISGAGPTAVAVVPSREAGERVAEAMEAAFWAEGQLRTSSTALAQLDVVGARVLESRG